LPSPGAGGAVVAFVLMQQDFFHAASPDGQGIFAILARTSAWILPLLVLSTGLLMVSNIRYPHFVNRYLRGRRSIDRLLLVLAILLLLVVAHRYTIGVCMLAYAFSGFASYAYLRMRPRAKVDITEARKPKAE
jgi:phosphatidylserine synthase